MTHLVMVLLVLGLGSKSFKEREAAQTRLTQLVVQTEVVWPVRAGLHSQDPEVRKRCQRVLDEYQNIPLSDRVSLNHFDDQLVARLAWAHSQGPLDEPLKFMGAYDRSDWPQLYIAQLFEKGMGRSKVLRLVKQAEQNAAVEQVNYNLGFYKEMTARMLYEVFPFIPDIPGYQRWNYYEG